MSRRGGAPARVVVVAVLALAWCASLGLGSASGFWRAGSTAPGSATAMVGSLQRPTDVVASATGDAVSISWTAADRGDGVPVSRYTVQRLDPQDLPHDVAGTCSGTVAATRCTDVGVPDGSWRYAVTPLLGTWTGPQSLASPALLVDTTPPTLKLPVSVPGSGGSAQSGGTVWFRGAAAGSLTLLSTVDDSGSGAAGASTTALAGATDGWTHTPGRVSTPAGGPYASNPFVWTAGTSGTATTTVTGVDAAGNTSVARTITLVDDSDAPTGATLDLTPGPASAPTVTLTLGTVSDTGSGVASRVLEERTAPLSGNTCGSFSTWRAAQDVSTTTVTRPVAYGTCVDYRYVVTDRVGNVATASAPGTVRNRSYPAVVLATDGRLDYYRLDDPSANAIADSYTATSTNDGTCTGGPRPGQAGAIVGDPDTALAFDGVDDSCSVTRSIGGTFSIELWFRAAGAGAGTTATWYSGAGLVGAEMLGLPSDFGVTFLQNGRVCAGTGLLTSLCTTTTYLDGWHHVVFTRDGTTGALVLYVDGTSRANAAGSLSLLTTSTTIRLGGLKAGGKFFKGSLDEVALYTTVLSAATVADHYQTGTG